MTKPTEINQLVDYLYRHESGRIVAVLTRIFGPDKLELAEDMVQDSMVEALSQWARDGIPENPAGWLFRVAKNKALNNVSREKYKTRYASDFIHLLQSEWTAGPTLDYMFSEKEIADDELRMMFTCCHPAISSDSQVALILKTLCGFSIPEIARAFLTNEDNIHKRLVRARQKIRESHIAFEIPAAHELKTKLQTVLETIYLLFNEGYSASTGESLIRYEVCEEAIRLTENLVSHNAIGDKADVCALLSLMQLNACRFAARSDADGNMLTLAQQDRSLWDYQLMRKGFISLENALTGSGLSVYHILALISSCHCSAPAYDSTDWKTILSLYDQLMDIDPSPIVRLNRSVALGKVHGADRAITELEALANIDAFKTYHLFYSVQAEFYLELGQVEQAADLLKKAIYLAPLIAEKSFLQNKLAGCRNYS